MSTLRTAQNRQAFAFREFKALDDATGTFEGYLAVFSNEDLGGDVIEPGAFTKTLQESRERKAREGATYLWPILWQHEEHNPCGGFLEAREDSHGLYVKGQLDLDTELGRRAYSGMKKGYLRGLSIGYDTIKHKWLGSVRHLQELRLWEGSACTFPMNPEATVSSVKGASGKASWPLAARDKAWDGAGAHNRIVKWATKDDGSLDTGKMRSVHFWYDDSAPDTIGSYKLAFCDVAGGDVQAIPRGIFACAGSHGVDAADIPSGDVAGVKKKIEAYYARMANEFDDDSIKAPWDDTTGGKAAHRMTRRQKARDFTTTLTSIQESDTLQEDWHDTFQAFVSAMTCAMWDAKYPPYVPDGQDVPDPLEAAQTNIDQFAAAMADLVKRSIAASFAPCLDDDGDSFVDPDEDEDNDDKGAYAVMSADVREAMKAERAARYPHASRATQRKAGRTLSADNHALLTKALAMIGQGHQAISEFTKANNPKNHGGEPPQQTDVSMDTGMTDQPAGDGKSLNNARRSFVRAGAFAARFPATTAAANGAAGAMGTRDAKQATTAQSAQATQDDELARFRALAAAMRSRAATGTTAQ